MRRACLRSAVCWNLLLRCRRSSARCDSYLWPFSSRPRRLRTKLRTGRCSRDPSTAGRRYTTTAFTARGRSSPSSTPAWTGRAAISSSPAARARRSILRQRRAPSRTAGPGQQRRGGVAHGSRWRDVHHHSFREPHRLRATAELRAGRDRRRQRRGAGGTRAGRSEVTDRGHPARLRSGHPARSVSSGKAKSVAELEARRQVGQDARGPQRVIRPIPPMYGRNGSGTMTDPSFCW